MPVKWNKIYRGGVHRTTPETREVAAPTTGSFLPGNVVSLVAGNVATAALGVAEGAFFYFVGEQMHGTVDEQQVGLLSSMRLYSPRSGDLYTGRAVASIALRDDMPLTVNAAGRLAAAGAEDIVHCYVDDPTSAYTRTPTPTVLDQLIPVKIK